MLSLPHTGFDMGNMAGVLQEAETTNSSGAPESTPSFLVGFMLLICFKFYVVFVLFWSCLRCSPEFVICFGFSFPSIIPLVFLDLA